MSAFKDLTGRRFGRLVAQSFEKTTKGTFWLCICDCSGKARIRTPSLTTGRTNSCGCLWRETVPGMLRTHQQSTTDIYRIWTLIIQRCENPRNPSYPRYGGRGIQLCSVWRKSFETFAADIGPRPSARHSVDRIDNARGYEPSNCRWATREEQANNSRKNRLVTFNGETKTLSQWESATGISQHTLLTRLTQLGWSVEKALTTPARKMNKRL